MKLLLSILISLAAALPGHQPDSLMLAKLDTMLVHYTAALEYESVEVKNGECDFLISSVSDSLLTQHIALWLFDHYKESPVMGAEAVAIHLWDNWFQPRKIQMRSEYERFDAEVFANFNRNTLLGMKAPQVTMLKPCGGSMVIPQEGRYSILFFYDTACAKCRMESELLPGVLKEITFPATFYAVYCGQDRKAWNTFRCQFRVRNPKVKVVHVWDPEIKSNYLLLYGVISTPRLYFADTDGEILGRRLEIESLAEIIHYICDYYGQAQKQ